MDNKNCANACLTMFLIGMMVGVFIAGITFDLG